MLSTISAQILGLEPIRRPMLMGEYFRMKKGLARAHTWGTVLACGAASLVWQANSVTAFGWVVPYIAIVVLSGAALSFVPRVAVFLYRKWHAQETRRFEARHRTLGPYLHQLLCVEHPYFVQDWRNVEAEDFLDWFESTAIAQTANE